MNWHRKLLCIFIIRNNSYHSEMLRSSFQIFFSVNSFTSNHLLYIVIAIKLMFVNSIVESIRKRRKWKKM